MVELWRLTRNRYGRAVYDALGRAGITATEMIEYVRPLEGTASTPPFDSGDRPCSIERCEPDRVAALDAPTHELADGEEIVAAAVDGEARGYLFCSVDATHEIHPLERELAFDGAYVRRVYVDPTHRGQGLASGMLAVACDWAAERGATEATALVAIDNRPSRGLFESHGFTAERKRRYARVGPLSARTTRDA